MTSLKFETSTTHGKPTKNQALVYLVDKSGKTPKLLKAQSDSFAPTFDISKLNLGSSETVTRIPGETATYALVSAPKSGTGANGYRDLGGVLARNLSEFEKVTVAFEVPDEAGLAALFEGFAIANYRFDRYKSGATASKLKSVQVISSLKLSASALDRIQVLAAAIHQTRDLVNTPANDMYPQALASWAQKRAKEAKVAVEVWDEKRLEKERCGGIVAVGKGSARAPRLIKFTYKPSNAKTHIAFVGKGITFDTGGLSLKPAGSMVGMKYDMTGAATVLNAAIAIAELKLPIAITAYACVAENMPSGLATRPNDVIKLRNGKTVEVMNTDAEGRLVLGDGLSLASEANPDLIVDVATLTGAATVALGNRYAGLMGSDDAVNHVLNATKQAGELAWHMPLPEDLRSVLDSPIADIANAKIGHTAGGMLIGGLFLKEFVGKRKNGDQISWAHLDIAGPANNDKEPYGHTPKGATGALVRSLVQLAENLATKN